MFSWFRQAQLRPDAGRVSAELESLLNSHMTHIREIAGPIFRDKSNVFRAGQICICKELARDNPSYSRAVKEHLQQIIESIHSRQGSPLQLKTDVQNVMNGATEANMPIDQYLARITCDEVHELSTEAFKLEVDKSEWYCRAVMTKVATEALLVTTQLFVAAVIGDLVTKERASLRADELEKATESLLEIFTRNYGQRV